MKERRKESGSGKGVREVLKRVEVDQESQERQSLFDRRKCVFWRVKEERGEEGKGKAVGGKRPGGEKVKQGGMETVGTSSSARSRKPTS